MTDLVVYFNEYKKIETLLYDDYGYYLKEILGINFAPDERLIIFFKNEKDRDAIKDLIDESNCL